MKCKILHVRLYKPTLMGAECQMHEFITAGQTKIDLKPAEVAFDEDPRFLRISRGAANTQDPKERYFELVPLTNVSSMMVEEVRERKAAAAI